MNAYSRYLDHPLSRTYTEPPPTDHVEDGDVPPEEIEVRLALAAWAQVNTDYDRLGLFDQLFRTADERTARAAALRATDILTETAGRTPEHVAAFSRFVSVIPKGHGAREALAPLIARVGA